jgi:MtN3 and saliva related transmembrane protein
MPQLLIDTIGAIGAILTTVCWLPQAIKIIREKETQAISLPTSLAFTLGVSLWLVYGFALADQPLIWSSGITLAHAGDRGAQAALRMTLTQAWHAGGALPR